MKIFDADKKLKFEEFFFRRAAFSGVNESLPKLDIFDGGLVDDEENLYLVHEPAYQAFFQVYKDKPIPKIDFVTPRVVSHFSLSLFFSLISLIYFFA